ncbi:tRNA (adenosine(37)-N6)-dimethylallyltransferase MiaA [Aquisalimonas lutea]|uniref:tRNA (adenosine(37)-N6)-dimethylallyltransferase MiaA n=1 Tax=Aquisalimonas lutea TaxID=1327750 RepID=UPI0025B40137|nr:tRNA (adenosine(37)-N6)-dimethylallyltransferase MiaA [Aquisalimonas lutea]MDN3519297.1 tRNA (adenosine(37)-N6)-dimethylallyltransferase MiaA [Aquisalimonas lutea]
MSEHPVPCIMGPTASGKTGVAVALAQRFPVRIISVDSAQVYRGMDIGTAKPDAATLAVAPHRLLDIRDPADSYSAADFCADVRREIDAARAAGEWPLLVGGSMLYFRALAYGLADLPSADAAVRREIEAEAAEHGWPALHRRLAAVDPASAGRIHPNDAQRIQRALEVRRLTGETMTARLHRRDRQPPGPALAKWVLVPRERSRLHRRIEERFEAMLAAGFVGEVEALRARGDLDVNLPSMRAVGYRQVWQYLDGEGDLATLRQRGVIATRQFAKRQLTWLRREADAAWLDPDADDAVEAVARWLAAPGP